MEKNNEEKINEHSNDVIPNEQDEKESLEDNNSNDYGSAEYWEERYKKTKGSRFDWLETFDTVYDLIVELLGENKEQKILNVGCGNGEIQDSLYEAGYHNIFNNDISQEVIAQMSKIKQEKNQEKMVYEVMDVTQMTYPSEEFDFVLDKSTIDALLCSEHPFINTAKMLAEIHRVLKPNGIYLAISYGGTDTRMHHLKRPHVSFDIRVQELKRLSSEGVPLVHYAYICTKGPSAYTPQQLQEFYTQLEIEEKQYYM